MSENYDELRNKMRDDFREHCNRMKNSIREISKYLSELNRSPSTEESGSSRLDDLDAVYRKLNAKHEREWEEFERKMAPIERKERQVYLKLLDYVARDPSENINIQDIGDDKLTKAIEDLIFKYMKKR